MTEYTINLGSARAAATAIRNLAERETDDGTKAAVLSIALQLEEQAKPTPAQKLAHEVDCITRDAIDAALNDPPRASNAAKAASAAVLALLENSPLGATSPNMENPEVLRVGIGEALPKSAAELSRMSVEAHIRKRANEFVARSITPPDPQEAEALARALPGADVAPEETEDWCRGVEDFRTAALAALGEWRAGALTAERKHAYDIAIKTVEGLLQ